MPRAAVPSAPPATAPGLPLEAAAELSRAQRALEASEERMRDVERLAGLGTWEMDPGSGAAETSHGLQALLGFPEAPIVDVGGFLSYVEPEDRERVVRTLTENVTGGGVYECGFRIRRVDGVVRDVVARAQAVARDDGSLVLRGTTLDVTDLKAAEGARGEFEAMFQQGFDGAPTGMALTDPVDGRFLRMNDAMGRLLGRSREELMKLTLPELIQPEDLPDGLSVRAGLMDGNLGTFESELRYLRPDGDTVWCSLHAVPIRASDGQIRAIFCQSIDISDRKAREAKLEREASHAVWLGRIRAAIDGDLLLLLGQPIIDLATGETVQHELLLRMFDPSGGDLIPPGVFLPVAERYGLISEIDCWVVRRAAERAAQGMAVGINLSGASVGDPVVMAAIERVLAETQADPSLLMFEVTETALMERIDEGRAFVEKLTALGCRFALDDFGTGFGTFVHLKHLPVEYLKIDMQFVRNLLHDEDDERVVRSIVNMAREFGKKTIGEGVEDEATLQRLRDLGVDYAQGFHIGRPAPTHEIAAPATTVSPESPQAPDRIALVRSVFEGFVRRDLDEIQPYLQPDVELRPIGTAKRAGRTAPYVGYADFSRYLQDVQEVWDTLEIRPQVFQLIEDGVAVFGEVIAQSEDGPVTADVVWVWKLRDGLVSSIQVFQS
jgi:PAS domain S-box-containing protein